MSKRNVVFSKPDEPLFLKKLKQQIGYCEGPTVETKREHIPLASDRENENDKFDEQPTIVVLNPGDLTAEEVELEKKKEAEKESSPADLSRKIIFNSSKKKNRDDHCSNVAASRTSDRSEKPKNSKLREPSANLLSFNQDEDEEDDEEEKIGKSRGKRSS